MLDILRPAASKARPIQPKAASPTLSPASSTSTLKASENAPRKRSSSISTARSKGQQARRQHIESAVTSSHRHKYTREDDFQDHYGTASSSSRSSPGLAPFRHSTLASTSPGQARARSKQSRSKDVESTSPFGRPTQHDQSRSRKRTKAEKPLLGGLYFSDLIVVAFFYAVNLLRTCGIAELVDVAFKGLAYACTRLPFDFYQRWSLSRAPSNQFGRYAPYATADSSRHQQLKSKPDPQKTLARTDTVKRPAELSRSSSTAVSSSDEDAYDEDPQLSPFHHLVLLLVRFACTSFPHLVPRVLFAEETIGPLVRWRTGGGAAGIVREFTSEQDCSPQRAESSSDQAGFKHKGFNTYTRPGFRAFWIGADAHVPVEVRRSDPSSRSATTLLYLHGGGFSLGSVAFYAEALIRIITKVCGIEDRDNDARCVAVEYDLGPTSRFPGPLLQCLRCYAHLIEEEGIDPASITIAGDSAGGNLTMAMLLCLDGQARLEPRLGERDWSKLPMPGKAVLISPWADLRPSSSLAFAPLREAATKSDSSPGPCGDAKNGNSDGHGSRTSAWTEAISQHEWDYVAAEALMHFAQLYAGVLKTPRRVRGPMGWVAHMCAALAGDDDDADSITNSTTGSKGKSSAATSPLAVLRTMIAPPKKLAKVAHGMLTEPLLNRAGATKPFASKVRPASDAFNEVEHIRPSAVGAFDPIFSDAERKTDAVPTTADLYIPLWESEERKGSEQETEKGKRQTSDPDFAAAKELLETSMLINPAIGDWSRIKLKRGMLVLWGDRERLADDIETWIDHVRRSQSSRAGSTSASFDDEPGQDFDPSLRAKSLQERRAASRSPQRFSDELSEHAADWLCTAVEHGPGGVHAWPFVSMYLAGSESEREKGLEIMARFIAELTPSPTSTRAPTPSSNLAVQLPAPPGHHHLNASAVANSPPHLNAISPAGSMPSDVSSRGDDHDFPFLGSSYTGSEGWDPNDHNELGLEGVYPHETVWPTPTPSTGAGTPLDSDAEQSSIGHDELVHRIGLGLGEGSNAGASRPWGQPSATPASAVTFQPVHLHRPVQAASSAWEGQEAPRIDTRRVNTRRTQPQILGGPVGGRSLADLEAESDRSAPPSQPVSPGWNSDPYDSHDEDLSGPSPQEVDQDAYLGETISYADDIIPMDPGFYGLAHYHTLRPEGLSDIAEEESQFDTSSVLSSGNGGLSPEYAESFSPADVASPNVLATHGTNPGRLGAAYTPSAAEMARLREALDERERQYRERFARRFGQEQSAAAERARFPIEEDDSIGEDSDADVDDLDMAGRDSQPWQSSTELAPAIRVDEQAADSSASTKVEGRPDELRVPSPAPSTSSRTSSAHDVWW